MPVIETWRAEAWCPEHQRQEHIRRVRSTAHATGTEGREVFQAVVEVACGERTTIITTARNLNTVAVTA